MAKLFFSYSHADEDLRNQLERQLAILKRQGIVELWHDRRIGAGAEFAREIDYHLEEADVILLLVSADFLASDYCYDREMKRALERHDKGSAVVIPVILRACAWHGAPFGKLLATPPDGRPVTQWPDRDQAFLEVAIAIRDAAMRLRPARGFPASLEDALDPEPPSPISVPRSSNLRLAKAFSDRDKDRFEQETFEFMAKYFENSLVELEQRNPGIETNFRRLGANRFTASIYKQGKAAARCTVFMSRRHFGGISYVANETTGSDAYNENLSVEADDQTLYFRPVGIAFRGGERDAKLSEEGAAEFYWSLFIEKIQ